MEAENPSPVDGFPTVVGCFFPFVVPVLLSSIGYVDPGKWAATVEGGARFGCDLIVLMFVFNLAAILCQYLSARIGVVTGRDLAQICGDEYDKWTCVALGVQTELSVILLDLTMVLGIAHGLNHLFEWDLFTCVFLTAVNAVLFPLFFTLMENCKVKLLLVYIAGFVLGSSILGVLINHPEMSLSMNGMLTKLNGESVFTLMSILGATIMPHNFYLHSSIVQHHNGPANVSKDVLFHNHFLAILCVFSGIYIVNFVLLSSAATAFYSAGLVLLTFQDAMSLVEQVFKGPIAPIAFLLVLFVSNQITALNWGVGGQVVLHSFLKLDIPGWLHCATIRIIAVIPALYCVWSSGAEGMYHLLLFTQVLVALLLPASVIPLFRIAASRQIMGLYKIPPIVEFLSLTTFIGMLGLKIAFVVEMVFGNSDWVGNLWNVASGSYVILIIVVCASFCLMLWLAATPLKSASVMLDAQAWNWDSPKAVVPDKFTNKEEISLTKSEYHREESMPLVLEASDSRPEDEDFDFGLPESLMEETEHEVVQLTTVEETNSGNMANPISSSSSTFCTEESTAASSAAETVSVSTIVREVSDTSSGLDAKDRIEKTVVVELDLQAEKDDEEGDSWETEDLSKGVPGTPTMVSSEGPGSFRSLSGKSDDGGNGVGSLSRLAGLGRAARRQLAAVLDEFWSQLYDFHGQATQEARTKKLDLLFGAEPKALVKTEATTILTKEIPSYPMTTSSLYDSPKSSSYGIQRGSSSSTTSLWSSNQMQLLDAYVQASNNRNVVDSGERRYSSVRNLSSSDSWGDYQPATVHGYKLAQYIKRNLNAENLNGQFPSQSMGGGTAAATQYRDSLAFAMGQKLQNGLSTVAQVSSIQNHLAASRSSMMQTDQSYYGLGPSGVADSTGTKKYHSLPDIHRDLYQASAAERVPQWDNNPGGFVSRAGGGAAPLAFDELSPSNAYRDALSSQMSTCFDSGSLWSRQPFEQFGLADTTTAAGSGTRTSPVKKQQAVAPSAADVEAKLLQSLRHCVVKLLKLEGSDWLFRHNDGADEELVERVAARERFLYEAEAREMNRAVEQQQPQYGSPESRKYSSLRSGDVAFSLSPPTMVYSVPHCGEGCVWKSELVVSFGVWCIHRVLDLSLMESRPELWGKYTYVLNRLQGIIDAAFSKPRTPLTPCFCLHVPASAQQRFSPPVSNGMPPPPSTKPSRGKCTTAPMVLDMIKDVEIAISCRKGRTGTAAGDVAFPKGKENLASVLKRYKRRLANKPLGSLDGPGSRKGLQ